MPSALAFLLIVGAGAFGAYRDPDTGQALYREGVLPSVVTEEARVFAEPVRIAIPVIGVDAEVEHAGVADGKMGVPAAWENVSWYERGAKPGETGRAVFAGHLDSYDGPAAFWNLKNLAQKDDVLVTDAHGAIWRYRVTHSEAYPDGEAPVREIFSGSGVARMVLVTCGGSWDDTTGSYRERLVVYADHVPAE